MVNSSHSNRMEFFELWLGAGHCLRALYTPVTLCSSFHEETGHREGKLPAQGHTGREEVEVGLEDGQSGPQCKPLTPAPFCL